MKSEDTIGTEQKKYVFFHGKNPFPFQQESASLYCSMQLSLKSREMEEKPASPDESLQQNWKNLALSRPHLRR